MEEGCLSIPRVMVDVKRAKSIWVEFVDEHNRKVRGRLNGIVARIFQHEFDHLNGKLILDYLSPKDRAKVLSLMKQGLLTQEDEGSDAVGKRKI